MRRLLAALALVIAATPAAAQYRYEFPHDSRAAQGDLFVAIATINDLDEFERAWNEGHLESAIFRTTVPGRELQSVVLVQGCRAGADGRCNISGRFTYLRPDGTEYAMVDQDDIWREAAVAKDNMIVSLGPPLTVNSGDPLGNWTLRAEVRDHVANTVIRVSTQIVVDTPPTPAR